MLYRQKILRDFRTRWEKEYLANLANLRVPRTNSYRIAKVDDVVLVHGDGPRLGWRLGRVVQLHQSEDGIIRVASVRLSGNRNVVKRSIRSLYPLEENETTDSPEHPMTGEDENDSPDINYGDEHNKGTTQDVVDTHSIEAINDVDPELTQSEELDKDESRRGRPRRAAALDADFKRKFLSQK